MELPNEVSAVLKRTAEGRKLHQKAKLGEVAPGALALLTSEIRQLEKEADVHGLARSRLLHTTRGFPEAKSRREEEANALHVKIQESLRKVSAIRYFVQEARRISLEKEERTKKSA